MDLPGLARLAARDPSALSAPVAPLRIGAVEYDTDGAPVIMATVNLSRDSTYRDSIAVSTESAVRKARVAAAQGAHLVDVGAESTTAAARRVGPAEQIRQLVPVVEACAAEGIAVSVETYAPDVTAACLRAGAQVLNLTGSAHQGQMFDLAAEHGASVVMCYSPGADVRQITEVELDSDPMPGLVDHFAERLELARAHGVEQVVLDPGMGFFYGNLVDPATRVRHQARVILNSYRLRVLGRPICQALPHAFDVFEEQYRSAEGFFAVLARLGGAGMLRTHEVALVAAVSAALNEVDVGGGWGE